MSSETNAIKPPASDEILDDLFVGATNLTEEQYRQVVRLRAENEKLENALERLWVEIERLRAEAKLDERTIEDAMGKIGELAEQRDELRAEFRSTSEDRLPIIKSCLEGLHRGEAEPLFIGDIDWAVAEIERLREERDNAIAAEKIALREIGAENERLRTSDEAREVQLERESARNERLRAVLWKIADDSAHADQYVRWAQEALG